jgi:HlyD family secretion protein
VIDPEPFKARRDQAASNLEMARANVARAKTDGAQRKRELERVRSLIDQNFVSQNDVDVAVTNAQGAEAQVHVAEAQVRQAEAALNSLNGVEIHHDSFAGWWHRLLEILKSARPCASFATPNLFLIALDLTKMQVDTNVSESDIGGIGEGKDATFSVDAYPGVRFSGSIRQVRLAPINVQNVVTYNVVVAVDNQDLRLKPGMTANVSIVVAQKEQVLKVPNAALRFTPPRSDRTEGGSAEGKPARAEGRPAPSVVVRSVVPPPYARCEADRSVSRCLCRFNEFPMVFGRRSSAARLESRIRSSWGWMWHEPIVKGANCRPGSAEAADSAVRVTGVSSCHDSIRAVCVRMLLTRQDAHG